MPALYEIYLAVLVALLLVAGYLALLLFLSWVGGWAVLAGAFRSGPFAPAKSHSFATANIASHEWPVAYARCLFVEFDERGIAMEIFPLFRFRHPPLLIPWSAVANCVRSRGVFYEWTTITLSGACQLWNSTAQ